MVFTRVAICVFQATHPAILTNHFGSLARGNNVYVVQAAQFFLQYIVCAHFSAKLNQRYMAHNTGKINRSFHTGVTATYHCNMLALEQRAVTVRTINNAFIAVFRLTWNTQRAPASTGREYEGACFE